MKVKISSKYSLVVMEVIWDAHQVIGHVPLVLRNEKGIYLEVS